MAQCSATHALPLCLASPRLLRTLAVFSAFETQQLIAEIVSNAWWVRGRKQKDTDEYCATLC